MSDPKVNEIIGEMERLFKAEGGDLDQMAMAAAKNVPASIGAIRDTRPMTTKEIHDWVMYEVTYFTGGQQQ